MGWTGHSTHGFRGSPIAFLKAQTSYFVGSQWTDGSIGYRITALQPGAGGVYGVLARSIPGKSDVKIALIIPARRKHDTLYIKTFTEFSYPYYYGMPESLFRQLSPLNDIYDQLPEENIDSARQWRAAVAEKIENDKRYGALVAGNVVQFRDPITFYVDGQPIVLRELTVANIGRTIRFFGKRPNGAQFLCSLSRRTKRDNLVVSVS